MEIFQGSRQSAFGIPRDPNLYHRPIIEGVHILDYLEVMAGWNSLWMELSDAEI
jgi:hypothetical protein